MHDAHAVVAEQIDDVTVAAAAYERGDDAGERERLLACIERLDEVLLPHLSREELEVMPIASDVLTDVEWREIEHEHNLAGKSFRQLGMEGHWLIDDVPPDDRATVLAVVPAVPRFILVHGFARSYKRRKRSCWSAASTRRVQKTGRSAVVIDTGIDSLWSVVRDPTRVGEWSHECTEVAWLDGASSAVPGARFRGRNRQGAFKWGRVCEVVSADPYCLEWRTVPTALFPDSTVWRLQLSADGDGTLVEQTFRVVRSPWGLDVIYGQLVPAHRDRHDALTEDLRRLGALASSEAAAVVSATSEGR
jgi:hypothetical protein